MEKQNLLKRFGIQAAVVVAFIALAYLYMFPLLEGKVLEQHDIQSHSGMAKELADYRKANGEEAVWTNSMFGGMPGYMISVTYYSNWLNVIQEWFRKLFHPAAMIILYLAGFYILLTSLKVNRWLSIAGALAFGFSTYLIIIIGAGHNTKAYALGYLMIVVAGVLMAYRSHPLKGALLMTVGLSFEIMAAHPQITYYGLLAMIVFVITELTYAIREKRVPAFAKTTGLLIFGAILSVMVNFSYLYSSYQYAGETIRGRSELTSNAANRTSGLDKDYVVQWSQGIDETLTLLIPGFMGGSHTTTPGIESASFKALQDNRIENPRQIINQVILYHGDKPFTSGPYYAGAIIVFLFVLGLFIVKGADKWWLLSATILSIVLSWGKYVMPLTSFLLDYLPLYNKFRATEMTLVIAGFTMPLLGFLGLQRIISGKVEKRELMSSLKWAFGITGGLALLLALAPGVAGSFTAPFDTSYPDWLLEAVREDRKSLLRTDAFRSFIFIALVAGILLLWYLKKIKTELFYGSLIFLILIDLWFVDKRFLNKENFQSPREIQNVYAPTVADNEILKDKDLSYRVLPLQNPWQDSRASYFHKNLGGYHPAKLRRYQEMIEHHFTPEIEKMVDGFSRQLAADSLMETLTALNMMNTRYIIYDNARAPIRNYRAWGNAWFAGDVRMVANADEEIKALEEVRAQTQVVVDKRFEGLLDGKSFTVDTAGSIILTEYKPNQLKYSFSASSDQLVAFSEVYYADGWKAYVDGKETPHFRANYILRAMIVPAGKHEVEFRFHPASYFTGNKVSTAGSALLLLAVAGWIFFAFRKKEEATGKEA